MSKRRNTILSFIAVTLSLSTIFYLPIINVINGIPLTDLSENDDMSLLEEQGYGGIINDELIPLADTTTNITGNYKTVAYFTQDSFVHLDRNGLVFEWENYEDVKDDAVNFHPVSFKIDNSTSSPGRYWHGLDSFDQLISTAQVNGRFIKSTVFSPEYADDTYIQGNVYFMNSGETYYSSYSNWTLRVTLELFDPATNDTTYITSTQGEYDDTDELGSYNGSVWDAMKYVAEIPETTLIPAGYRLRATYEGMLGSASYTGPSELMEVRSGTNIYPSQWYIDSTNNTYDNHYYIENAMESFGIQLLMYQENYPTIDLTGLVNNTIYTTPTNGTVTVSSDSHLNQYKWDSGSFTSFNSPFIVSLPESTGWHTLTIQGRDHYDNIAEAKYVIGYDETVTNIVLHTPANNSLIADGELLNFSIYDYLSVTYEWNHNTTLYSFSAPFDIYPSGGFTGLNELTIHITDQLGTESFNYVFIFDNTPPDILLVNVENGTIQPQGKNIDIIIDDRSHPIDVQLKWDEDSYSTWSPFLGNLYRTYLPSTAGLHNLSVFANDTYGNSLTKIYQFNTSLTLLNVDLFNLVNSSYYKGGNTVEVTITNDNGTVRYFWGTAPWSIGSVSDNIMTLSGGDALSSTPGTYRLTVIVGNLDHEQFEFIFIFTVDQMDPTIVQEVPIPDYNGTRFLDSTILSFTIADNLTSEGDLVIFYSIDNANNLTLKSPFQVYLYGLSDGLHNLTIYVEDIAGNDYRYFITFIIDTTK
ncbi:MAG: hypothetical protein ACTSSH_06565 [Candidatus Heimdallarchaeota archaeon]